MAVAVAVTMNCVWGGNPVAVKLGLEAFPPFWTAFLRFCLGIACVGIWARFAGIRLLPTADEWKPFFGLSVFFGVQIWLMNVGYGLTTGVMGSVLISVYPLVAALLGNRSRSPAIGWTRSGRSGSSRRSSAPRPCSSARARRGQLELFSTGNWLVLLSGTLLGVCASS